MSSNTILITQLGETAHQVLERCSAGQVMGSSSRGVFLQPRKDWTLFISREGFPGPLTINVNDPGLLLNSINPGSSFQVSGDQIIFSEVDLSLDPKDSQTWKPGFPSGSAQNLTKGLQLMLNLAPDLAGANPYYPLLNAALGGNPIPLPGLADLAEIWIQLLRSMISMDFPSIKNYMGSLLGSGPGLTPLGDDLLLGVMLTHNRWSELIPLEYSLPQLNNYIINTAGLKTTKVSTSLLFCASNGSADQRLIQVLDGLFTDEWSPREDISRLLDWGSSSGIAVLAGMIGALRKP